MHCDSVEPNGFGARAGRRLADSTQFSGGLRGWGRPLFHALTALAMMAPSWQRGGAAELAQCTESALRAAVEAGGSITFPCTSLTLSNAIVIEKHTTLEGGGRFVTISGANATRLFVVNSGVQFVLKDIRLVQGRQTGANVTNGLAGQDSLGAAIFNNGGWVALVNSTVEGHTVTGGAGGKGLDGVGGSISGSHGGAGGRAGGGAIYNYGMLFLTNVTFLSNTATAGAGGAGGNGSSGGNGGHGGNGGDGGLAFGAAVYNAPLSSVTAVDCYFISNKVAGAASGAGGLGGGVLGYNGRNGSPGAGIGGAIFNDGGTITLLRSTFAANTATGANGPTGADGRFGLQGSVGTAGSSALGGAIATSGAFTVTNSTFYGNFCVGGNGGQGGAGGGTGVGGDGGRGGSGGSGLGGGIYSGPGGTSTLVNVTLSHGSARGGEGGAGGEAGSATGRKGSAGDAGTSGGGGVYNDQGAVQVKNSIVANSISGGNGGGPIADLGFNLSSDASMRFSGTSQNEINPELKGLANNGGVTPTMAIASNSPAADRITPPGLNGGPETDQRNARRSAPGDIGAFEWNGFLLTPALGFERQTNGLALLWPSSASNYVVLTATNLGTNVWISLTNAVQAANGTNRVTISPSNPINFYRLGKPF